MGAGCAMSFFIRGIAILILAVGSCTVHAEYALDSPTAKLVDCGDVMAYAANFALMANNEGQARVFFHQHARAVAALFAKNYVNGVIPGERTESWKARSPATKRYLDANQATLSNVVNGCYPIIQNAVDEPKVRTRKMWGMDFPEFVESMAAKTRAQYGLR